MKKETIIYSFCQDQFPLQRLRYKGTFGRNYFGTLSQSEAPEDGEIPRWTLCYIKMNKKAVSMLLLSFDNGVSREETLT